MRASTICRCCLLSSISHKALSFADTCHHTTTRDLSNNSIDGLAMSFVFPPSLHSLFVFSLYPIPSSFFPVCKTHLLVHRNLSSNKLAALPLQRMDLPNVTALDLSHNTLSALPEMTAPLLERLDISSNFVHTLPDSFRDFKHLTSVFVLFPSST